MTEYRISFGGWLLIVALAVLFGIISGPSGAHGASAPNTLTLVSSSTFEENGETMTQFTYWLEAGTPEPSHVVLAICLPRFVRVVGWDKVEIGHDPTTNFTGVKLDNLDGQDLLFSVIVRGEFSGQTRIAYAVKAGQDILRYDISGPACTPTAVALSGFSAEQMDGSTARYMVLFGLAFAAGIIVALWVRQDRKGE